MDFSILMEYSWVLLVLVVLEGLLATDNALVLAIMVKHLPEEERRKALFYGLAGAFIFRFGSLFVISFLIDVWQVQAIGAAYLIFMCLNHLFKHFIKHKSGEEEKEEKPKKQSGFWMTVFKVEVADIAFAVDSILAAVALGVTLPELPIPGYWWHEWWTFHRDICRWFYRINHYAFCCKYVRQATGQKAWFRSGCVHYCWMGWV